MVIVRFRLLASDLSQYDIRYRVNSSLIKVPYELNYDMSPSDLPYSATLKDCNDESSSRQCKDLAILITGRPNIHALTFTPDFFNVANVFFRVPVVTDKLFRIHYQGMFYLNISLVLQDSVHCTMTTILRIISFVQMAVSLHLLPPKNWLNVSHHHHHLPLPTPQTHHPHHKELQQ